MIASKMRRISYIIIATSYKSGTTWMQEIVRQLIFLGQDVPERYDVALGAISFWLDANSVADDALPSVMEAVSLDAMRARE